jgi:hypothetical protein
MDTLQTMTCDESRFQWKMSSQDKQAPFSNKSPLNLGMPLSVASEIRATLKIHSVQDKMHNVIWSTFKSFS